MIRRGSVRAIDRLEIDKVKEKEKIKQEKKDGMAEGKKLLKQIKGQQKQIKFKATSASNSARNMNLSDTKVE